MSDEWNQETRDQRYDRQTRWQFEALGRFVQAFELMIDAIRTNCVLLASGTPKQQRLINIAFHHTSMGADALFAIMRAMFAEIVIDLDYGVPAKERDVVLSILQQMAKQFISIRDIRNELLHGTWQIGWSNPSDDDFSDMNVFKYKATSKGFQASDKPPRNAEALDAETLKC